MAIPSIGLIVVVLNAGTIGKKFGLVGLHFSLFTSFVLLMFTKLLGDMSGDLTSGSVGELCTCSCSGASVDSLDSLSSSEID